MRALDWLGRTLFLIVSGCATYALIAAIASLSSSSTRQPAQHRPMSGEVATLPVPSAPETPLLTDRAQGPSAAPATNIAVRASGSTSEDRIAGLLETLTHAVLALTGFVAAGVLVLLRISSQLHRGG